MKHRRLVMPSHKAIGWQILIRKRKNLQAARRVPPVMHEVHNDGEHALQNDASIFHTPICVRRELIREGAAGFGVGEDGVA